MKRHTLLALALAVGLLAGGCARGEPEVVEEPAQLAKAFDRSGASPSPSPTPSAKPTPKPTAKPTPSRKPPPTRKPPTETKVPPAPKPPPSTCTAPKYVGPAASRAEVRAALETAATKVYWPTSAPSIRVPEHLVKAVAWQESGWQSNIVACDTGTGLMQVQPPTAQFVNDRFGQSYNLNDYRDNATLGANYLAWLVKYFGDVYFEGNYDLTVEDPDNPVLLDAVIAAYNVGFGKVDTTQGLVIPNRQYVNNVIALMQRSARGEEPPA